MNFRRAIAVFRGEHEFHMDLVGPRRRRIWFLISGAMVLLSIGGLLGPGLNLGIDFRGGALLTYPNEAGASAEEIREALAEAGQDDAVVQFTGERQVRVRTAPLDSGERGDVLGALAAESGIEVGQISTEAVGPKWGEQISVKALQGLIVFLVLVSIYISFRFEWKMAIGGITSLVHDLAITAGVYAWVGREVTPETVIAVLTILGYSLYDTVVIFDRIKENVAQTATLAREGYGPVVNRSLNQVFMRSFNTTITTLFPITALMLFGGETLKGFAFALFVGVVLGGYSSLFVAAPLVTVLKEREQRFAEIRDRVARREDLAAVRGEKAPAPETHERRELVTAAPRPSASTAPRRRPKKKSRSKRKKR